MFYIIILQIMLFYQFLMQNQLSFLTFFGKSEDIQLNNSTLLQFFLWNRRSDVL